ncbi:MAG: hypothetical protein ABIN35_00810 [candidate division WOR-3 bacterium]
MLHLKLKPKSVLSQIVNQPTNDFLKPYRDKVLENLPKTGLNSDLVIPLENSIYQQTMKIIDGLQQKYNYELIKNIYMYNARHIIDNLRKDSQIGNTELVDKVNSGQITVQQLVELTPEEMHPNRWQHLIDKKNLEIKKLTTDPEATSSLFWCSRCHRNKTTYFERQDRSADEPMTIHITCCYCGHKWRM